ncbi:MAG: hypothetical protein RL754_1236 [Bacteroidota bacterium]|jgi:tetratricopeptide (TPR) repeat protein
MKKMTLAAMALLCTMAYGQELPQPSPTSTVEQRVGLTDLEIVYSRPSVKGREIFGDLVPMNEVWRTGANACTKFNTSSDIKVAGKDLSAGDYALFTIPGEENWTIIFSTQTNLWGNSGYSEDGDVLRVEVPVSTGDFDESFFMGFSNLSISGAQLDIEWADVEVHVPITVDSESQSAKNVARAIAEANNSYRNAASFYSGKGDHVKALETIEFAVKLDPNNWYTQWVMAEILQAAGKTKEAKAQGKKAIDMGQEFYDGRGMAFTYRAGLEKDLAGWK